MPARSSTSRLPSAAVITAALVGGAAVAWAAHCGAFRTLGWRSLSRWLPWRRAGRTLIVGDVHGCSTELRELLEVSGFRPGVDQLVLVGDLVAKGPDSLGVLELARRMRASVVRGNHENIVLEYADGVGRMVPHSDKQGGQALIPKFPEHAALARELPAWALEYMRAMPLWLRLPEHNVLVVHAGLPPGTRPEDVAPNDLMNMRSLGKGRAPSSSPQEGSPWASMWRGPELVVFGHDAIRGFQDHELALGLDTGCCYGRALTGVWFPGRSVVSVKAKRVYSPPNLPLGPLAPAPAKA